MGSSYGKLAVRVIGVLVGLLVAVGGFGVADGLGMSASGSEVGDRGTATVLACRDEGFVHLLTVGDLWSCDLDVRWDSGRTERVVGELTQFDAADVGRRVAVVERQVKASKAATRPEVFRADFEPRSMLFYYALILVPVFVGGTLALGSAISAKALLTGNRSRRAEPGGPDPRRRA